MKTYIVNVVSAIFVGVASTAYAASTTVTINAIDANGVGKKIGTIELSDTKDMRMKSEAEVSDDFEEHFANNAGHYLDPGLMREVSTSGMDGWSSIVRVLGFTDPEIIATFAEGAGPTIQWLKSFGVRFDVLPNYFLTACQPRMGPVGGGLALVEALGNWVEEKGARVLYETTARHLLQGEDGAVVGVEAAGADGRTFKIEAKSTVLACGGFEGNPEMLARYLGPRARYLRPVARGGYYNKGEGIRMALDIGAAPCGDYGSFHAEPLDPRSGAPEPVVLVFNYGILVNKQSQRFVDEAPATVDATYESITRLIHEQAEGIAYLILDSKISDVPNWRRAVRSDQPPVSAPTLAALATRLGLDAEALQATVEAFNNACPEDAGFRPLQTDGLSTAPGYVPRKSNWSRRIERGPFLAYPIICGNCFTFGGLKVNTRSQVLDSNGVVIPGLYAGGELIGLYYGTYPGATSVLRGAVFGRIAGEDAARQARLNRAAVIGAQMK